MNAKAQNIGVPPGTLIYTGEARTDRIKITLIHNSY